MGDSSAPPPPPPPDYTPIAMAQKEIAEEALAFQREQFEWAKQAYAENREVSDQVVEQFLEQQEQQNEFAQRQRERYESEFQPLEDDLIAEARDYGTEGRMDQNRGRAVAAVGQQFDAIRQNAQRELEGYGINPASTRYAALDIGIRSNAAAAKAAAANEADQNTENTARALRSEAINVGRGYPSTVHGAYASGAQGGAGAVNSGNSTTATGSATMGTPTQWAAIGQNALGAWGNTLNQSYNDQMKYYNAQQQAENQSSGWGSALGMAAGIGSKFLFGFEKGGAVGDDERDMPFVDHHYYVIPSVDESGRRLSAEEAMKRYLQTGDHVGIYPNEEAAYAENGGLMEEGSVVPEEASPTSGEGVDDVKAQLTAGEFVVPKEAVEWYGQKYFQTLIKKAKEEKANMIQDTGAAPSVGMEQPGPTMFKSQSALPQE